MTEPEQRIGAVFDDLFRMSDAELRLLRLGWDEVPAEAREAAWQVVRTATRQHHEEADLIESGRETLSQWVNGYLTTGAVGYGPFPGGSWSGMDQMEVRQAAIPPTMDAVAAIVAERHLSDAERETLLAAWRRLREERAAS